MINKDKETENIINSFIGLPNEFVLLKGVLLLNVGSASREFEKILSKYINFNRIAQRMDELNKAVQ